MLLALFITFLSLGLLLIFLGYYSKESVYSFMGWSFLFFLGASILLPGNLEYQTGTNTTTTYTYSNSTLSNTIITETRVQTNLTGTSSHFFGFWLTFLSVAGIAISLSEVQSAFSGKKNWGGND